MKENRFTQKPDDVLNRAMEAASEQAAMSPLRDVLKREYDEAQKRPRNIALEKWGQSIDEIIERDMDAEGVWRKSCRRSIACARNAKEGRAGYGYG